MSRLKTAQTVLMDKKLRETTNLCVEIMNSKRQVKGELVHVVQVLSCANLTLNLFVKFRLP